MTADTEKNDERRRDEEATGEGTKDTAIEGLENTILEQGEQNGKLLVTQDARIEALEERIDALEAGMDKIPELIAKQGAGVRSSLPDKKSALSGIKPVKHPVTRKWVLPDVAKKAQLKLDRKKKEKKKDKE